MKGLRGIIINQGLTMVLFREPGNMRINQINESGGGIT